MAEPGDEIAEDVITQSWFIDKFRGKQSVV
jgi:hypothetical protein